MPSLDELRARAAAHQEQLDRNTKYFKVADLVKRWGISATSVNAISRERLPYMNAGTGHVREHRRYHPDDVFAYEQQYRRKAG